MQSRFLPEIDLLRGLAVVMMIANHAANRFVAEANLGSGTPYVLAQFGSFAPVLFFFATGLGIGFQSALGRRTSHATLKMFILIAADIILAVAAAGEVRFDFLSFIGVSTLVCALLARTRHSETVSIVSFLLVVALRFVSAHLLRIIGVDLEGSIANVVLGVYPNRGLAYSLAPWLCFPLLGYYLGHRIPNVKARGDVSYTKLLIALLMAGLLALAISAIATKHGAAFYRWGMVSAAYFVAAVGVALLTLAIFGLLERRADTIVARLFSGLKIRGIACLAIVPIHYVLIESLWRAGLDALTTSELLLVFAALVPLCLLLGRVFERFANFCVATVPHRTLLSATIVVACILLWLCYAANSTAVAYWLMCCGQLSLCVLLLAISSNRKQSSNADKSSPPAARF